MRYPLIIFRALFLGYPYWRITYKDGGMTRLLTLKEALDLYIALGGFVWIDFEII